MPNCKHHEICGLSDDADPKAGFCILHSQDPGKEEETFAAALEAHRKKNGDNFTWIVFPGYADFRRATFTEAAKFPGGSILIPAIPTEGNETEETKYVELIGVTFTEGASFIGVTFTKGADFNDAAFTEEACFEGAKFAKVADFERATFTKRAGFRAARFTDAVHFYGVTFTKEADFHGTAFGEKANFGGARFTGQADFHGATFREEAGFVKATFSRGADFRGTSFKGENVDFSSSSFQGRILFASPPEKGTTVPIFSGVEIDFRQVVVDPPDALSFRDADLRKCRFLDTDLRKVEMTGVIWPQVSSRFMQKLTCLAGQVSFGKFRREIGTRFGVYDEIAPSDTDGEYPWARIERLYRELKQNYEDRRDYERAGDLHYGEKEMRRKNPETGFFLWLLLTLYQLFSRYGEGYLPPLIWAGVLLVVSTFCYLVLGISPRDGGSTPVVTSVWDWLRVAHYSFRVMTFLKADDFVPIASGKFVNTIESLLGPLFLGLFALAVRQRLKR